MAQSFDFTMVIPVKATFQDEELAELKADYESAVAEWKTKLPSRRGMRPTLMRMIRAEAQRIAVQSLKVGAMQHSGALIVVESREPDIEEED